MSLQESSFTNQQIINAIYAAARVVGKDGWDLLKRAGLTHLVQDRQGTYQGPDIAALSGLTPQEKAEVQKALGLTPTPTTPPTPSPALPGYTNQQIINAVYAAARALGKDGWAFLKLAGLTHLVYDRKGAYQGPAIEALPGLSAQEKALVKEALEKGRVTAPPPPPPPPAVPTVGVAVTPTTPSPTAPPLEIIWAGPTPNMETTRYGYSIDMIVIHFTASGSAASTIDWFRNPHSKVSVHYVLGRDGRVYQMVKDEHRAHHAGQGPLPGLSPEVGEQRRRRNLIIQPNSRSIGIEIVNWGELRHRDGKFYLWVGKEYTGEVVQAGGRYWQPYTEAQYASLIPLVAYLCRKHGIPAQYPPLGPGVFDPEAERLAHFRGILGHQALDNLKSDPGPHFDWQRLLEGVRREV